MSKSRLIIGVALSLMSLPVWAGDKSLVLYLPLDEGAGTTAKDVSSYDNPGTIVGGAAWVPGHQGMALQFVSGSRVTCPDIPPYDVTAALSVMAWVKTNTVPNWARVVDKSQWQTTGFDLVLTQNVGLARLEFFVNNTTSLVDSTTVVANNEWHFIVGTFGNKTLRMYVDGKQEGQAPSTGQVDINPNNWPLMIGAESSSNGGQQYFGSIDEVAMYNRELSAAEVTKIFQGGMAVPELAANPQPKNGAVDVPRDVVLGWTPGRFAATHDVYLGGVSKASRVYPADDVLVSSGQTATTYQPAAPLEYEETYFWRVDEVNKAPDNTIFKGDTWSFTVEPFSYPVVPIAATASGSAANMGPQNTINGSGLNADGEHSTDSTQMWLSNGVKPAWIQYEFAKVYKLDQLQVWNSNQGIESILGFGARSVTVEYSVDGQTWTALKGVPEFYQATGTPTYKAITPVNFGGVDAKFVKLTINTNWGGAAPQTGLSEVRFFYIPVQARSPQPATAARSVSVDVVLNWRPGRQAASHKVYFGTDPNAVAKGSAPAQTVADHGFTPTGLNLGTTYYWRVDEVNAVTYPGDVWSFTTQDYQVVDDFESYTDADGKRIYQTWIDGLTTGASRSQVGYDGAPFAEKTIVHSGQQSMPLKYDNSAATKLSEAERTFDPPQDWTQHGVTALVVYFRGQVANSPAALYLKINGTKVPFNNNAATALPVWRQWTIPLAATGANLKSVKTLTIGVEGGGTGTVFIDDIRLYAVAPQAVSPADPGATGLVALYTMDGNTQDTSGNNYHGAIRGDTKYEAGYVGQALVLNGTNAYVELPIGTLVSSLADTTVATHVYFRGGTGAWQRIFDFGSGTSSYMFLCPRQGTSGNMRFGIRSATVNEQIVNSPGVLTVGWHHVAVAINSQAKTITLYVDGERIASGATAVLPKDLGKTTQNWIGKSQYTADAFFYGSVDDFRIYNRALSAAEVRYLAGDR